jgi:cytochrome c oxidase cbb3-type subunit II
MWEKKPILFMVMATIVILVGTVVTTFVPLFTVNTDADKIEGVVPYTPLEQEGRDVYIREGCNNCHSQTVRPLVAEVLRYGEYSKSGEFVYDRPFLWGSKRTGPDLARIGGKYPDAWHYKHMDLPRSMVPRTNMPDYKWLRDYPLDADMIVRKMEVLGFPYTKAQITDLQSKNEMDAIVAYMQKLGSDIDWRKSAQTEIVGDLVNPFAGDAAAISAGAQVYDDNCVACHGSDLSGDIGPSLTGLGYDDAILYELIFNGLPDGGMPGFSYIGSEKVWKVVNFIQSKE